VGDRTSSTRAATLDCVSPDRHADISKFFRACDSRPVGTVSSDIVVVGPGTEEKTAFRAALHEALTMKAQVRGSRDAFRGSPPVWAGQRLAERLHC
jgi:hypothetical protein